MDTLVVIPARMASTRLPGKPLADLGGAPMILRVLERALLARIPGRVLVATDDERIVTAVRAAGGEAVLTRADHVSGSDRIHEALAGLDYEVVVNVQGDEPFVDPELIDRLAEAAMVPGVDVVTAAAGPAAPGAPPSAVRVLVDPEGRAIAFARHHLAGGRCLHHVGIYAYRRASLEAFVGLAPSEGEKRERLEQLRLLERGYTFAVVETAAVPLAVDTPGDLEAARARFALSGAGIKG